jgi:hypothetical protein
MDGSVKLRGRNINELIDKNLSSNYISLHKHILRDCVYEEEEACAQMKKDGSEILAKQVEFYRQEGLPVGFGVFETAEISRDHNAFEVHQINTYWWQQLDKFSIRDQVSLPYVFWKHGFENQFMNGNQWLDAYFHIYKHAGEKVKLETAVAIVIPIFNPDTKLSERVEQVFETTSYPSFSLTLLLDSAASYPESEITELSQKYGDRLSFITSPKLSLSAVSDFIKSCDSELCCLLEDQVKLINNDWLGKLVEGMMQDDSATIAGPTILDQNYDFVASGVRFKRKEGQLVKIYNSRKLGGTGTVQALHQSCTLFRTENFKELRGFNKQFTELRSALIALSHANTQKGYNSRLVLNSEVVVLEDNETVSDFDSLKAALH